MEFLISSVDDNDIFGCLSHLPEKERSRLLALLSARIVGKAGKRRFGANESKGPIASALVADKHRFGRVFLFSSESPEAMEMFAVWLADEAGLPIDRIQTYHPEEPEKFNPIDYPRIAKEFSGVLDKVVWEYQKKDDTLTIFLTPGTPAMTVTWVLLEKAKYPASFLQTYGTQNFDVKIPFDLHAALAASLDKTIRKDDDATDLLGESPAFLQARERLSTFADYHHPVLLTGETGTGKERFAGSLHKQRFGDDRKTHPFIPVNCGAIPEQLLDAELFGYVKGAFTGAEKNTDGAFQKANNGTLFLDEIGDMPLHTQARLLRATQPRKGKDGRNVYVVNRVGSFAEEEVNIDIICATNRNLADMVAKNQFRQDLLYRINPLKLHLPPLRERDKDVILVAKEMLGEFSRSMREVMQYTLDASAEKALCLHDWPGNLRELHNVMIRLAVTHLKKNTAITEESVLRALDELGVPATQTISPESIPDRGFDLKAHLESIETEFFRSALRKTTGNHSKAAQLIGYNYQTFTRLCQKAGIKPVGK